MSERKSNALSCVIKLEENMNVYIQGPVTRRVFNKSAITSHWVDLTFHHHLDLNQSPQGPRTIGGEKKTTEIRFCQIIYLFQMHNWEANFLFFRTAFLSSLAYAFFLKVTPAGGERGMLVFWLRVFWSKRWRERGVEGKNERGWWWKDKNAAMKWRGKEICKNIRLLVQVQGWSTGIYF